MGELIRAKNPFIFYTRVNLTELTGLKASTLQQLLWLIKEVPGSSIYHHTHRFLQQHQYLSPEPPNDFAYWVSEVLGEDELGERLASIDTIQFAAIHSLREKIISTIEVYLKERPVSRTKFAHEEEAFYFMKSVSFIVPTPYKAYDLKEFVDILEKVTLDSIYYHIFEARLRLEKKINDFAKWIEVSFGDAKLARELSMLDPYTYTLDDLRKTVIKIVKKKIPK